MTDDPLTRYAALMNRAHAPRELSRAVLDRIESQHTFFSASVLGILEIFTS